jgi:hypothetical protein
MLIPHRPRPHLQLKNTTVDRVPLDYKENEGGVMMEWPGGEAIIVAVVAAAEAMAMVFL